MKILQGSPFTFTQYNAKIQQAAYSANSLGRSQKGHWIMVKIGKKEKNGELYKAILTLKDEEEL